MARKIAQVGWAWALIAQPTEGTAYLVMEFLRGASQTADALRAAHEKHIVFGSLRPGSQLHQQTRLPSA